MSDQLAISVCDLSKKYKLNNAFIKEGNKKSSNDFWVLKNINFQVEKGSVVGIIGSNGSGKSTLLKILSGITKPTIGEVVLNGRVASILDIGAGFHSELSGYENIFLHAQIFGFKTAEIEQKKEAIINFSGIRNFINEPVKNYSNGMYLRLAFSIVMHLDFDIYLFDEVFSVGDIAFQERSEQRIKELVASGKTMIMVSHNLSELKICDYTIELKQGEIVSTKNKSIANYVENFIASSYKIIESGNVILKDFNNPSELLTVIELLFFQDKNNGPYNSTKPFHIRLHYTKKTVAEFIPAFLVKDSLGQSLILTGPFLSSNFDVKSYSRAGEFMLECSIPKNLFSADIYSISLLFFENISFIFMEEGKPQKTTDFGQVKIMAHYDKLIHFKPLFEVNDSFVDFSKLNAIGGLLIDFEWGIHEHNTLM